MADDGKGKDGNGWSQIGRIPIAKRPATDAERAEIEARKASSHLHVVASQPEERQSASVADLSEEEWRRPEPVRRSERVEKPPLDDAPLKGIAPREESAESEQPQQRRVDVLRKLLIRTTRDLGRPIGAADIQAAAPGAGSPMTLDGFKLAAERLDFPANEQALNARSLERVKPPFIAIDHENPMAARSVVRREGAGFLVFDPVTDDLVAMSAEEVLQLGHSILRLKEPEAASVRDKGWRSLVIAKMRGVLLELAVASLMINIFALAAPLFIMTVFNKVVGAGGGAEATLFSPDHRHGDHLCVRSGSQDRPCLRVQPHRRTRRKSYRRRTGAPPPEAALQAFREYGIRHDLGTYEATGQHSRLLHRPDAVGDC